ncbi:hypothetical protein VTL71DRAFT_15819, partial [Oculimacula yallundae]
MSENLLLSLCGGDAEPPKLLNSSAMTKEDYGRTPQTVSEVLEFYSETQFPSLKIVCAVMTYTNGLSPGISACPRSRYYLSSTTSIIMTSTPRKEIAAANKFLVAAANESMPKTALKMPAPATARDNLWDL